MKKKDLEKIKGILLDNRKKAKKNLEYLKTIVRVDSTKEGSGDQSAYSFHMADQGTDAMEREKAFMFFERDEKYIKQIDEAMQRIENGTFGVCRACGEEIEIDRLEAVPTTTICYDCKTKGA